MTGSIFGYRLNRSHQRVVPLCPRHHFQQFGPKESVEALSHRGFYFHYGINLEEEGERLWKESEHNVP